MGPLTPALGLYFKCVVLGSNGKGNILEGAEQLQNLERRILNTNRMQ